MGTFYVVEVMEYQSTEVAEAGTTQGNIVITDHGLVALDMIVIEWGRTSDTFGNNGSRQVYDVGLDDDNIPINTAFVDASSGQDVRLYKYINRTALLTPASFKLTRKAKGESIFDFEIITTAAYLLTKGQNVRVKATTGGITTYEFWGCVASHDEVLLGAGQTKIKQTISCQGASSICQRRTIEIDELAGATCGSIVQKMVDDYLFSEGIRMSTIDAGGALEEEWTSDTISIKEVLDVCAEKSGFPWYINDEGQMVFEDAGTVANAPHTLEVGVFDSYFDLKCSTNSNDYFNKNFFVGGVDDSQNEIRINRVDNTEIYATQDVIGGTGVFGMVTRETGLTEEDYRSVESGSTTTTIKMTAHGMNVGDMIFNWTRAEYRTILTESANQFTVAAFSGMTGRGGAITAEAGTTTIMIKSTAHGLVKDSFVYNATRNAYRKVTNVIDADSFNVKAITGQVAGDTLNLGGDIIGLYPAINKILAENLAKQSIDPTVLTFKTPEAFQPNTKLRVKLPTIGITDAYFLIEDVEIYDTGSGDSTCWYRVKATRRNNSNFSVQRKISYKDYWRDF